MMHIRERRKYLRIMRPRYLAADRRTRGNPLDEMEAVTYLDRKTLIRLMHTDLERKRRSRERGSVYNALFRDAVQGIAETLDYPCAERLQPALLPTARHLARDGELRLTPRLEQLLGHGQGMPRPYRSDQPGPTSLTAMASPEPGACPEYPDASVALGRTAPRFPGRRPGPRLLAPPRPGTMSIP